jgi:hypothetical protein
MDPTKETWAISVKSQYADEAKHYICNLREIDHFFSNERASKEWVEVINSSKIPQDDNDDWFDDKDDIEDLVKKGLIDPSFIHFLKGKEREMDRQSKASSWGTGDTAYTEFVDNQDATGTVNSSITQESSFEVLQDIQRKKELVIDKLKENGLSEAEINDILENAPPYELVFSGIQLQSWKPERNNDTL